MKAVKNLDKNKEPKMTERYTVQFMVRISEELRDRLAQDAVGQDRSMAYIARQILEDHYDVSSAKETLNAYKAEMKKLSAPAKQGKADLKKG